MLIHDRPLGTVSYLGGMFAVHEEFCWCWGEMRDYNARYMCQPGAYVDYRRARVSYHAQARNSLVESFRGDWLLQIDADHTFEPDLCARMVALLEQYDLDVLTGKYMYRVAPYPPVLYMWSEVANGFIIVGKFEGDSTLYKVDCAGGGCLLVRRRVFDRIKRETGESPFHPLGPWSEDFSFFKRCMDLGIAAYCAPAIECGHLQARPITAEDYDPTGLPVIDKDTGVVLG